MQLNEEYETGVVWQDFQHRQLIELFKKVELAHSSKKDENLFRYTIAFLSMYTNHHFKLEEEYMEKYNYPAKKMHYKEHQGFEKELKEFRAKNLSYTQAGAENLMKRMGEWILSHILEDDQKLGQYILSAESKKS